MSLPHALLGLLAVEPASGYALTKAFETDLGRYAWHAGHTSIYPELGRLAEQGLVEVTAEGPRGSRTYAVTPAGRAELRSWLLDEPAERGGRVRNEHVLRMFMLSALDPADARVALARIAKETAAGVAELRRVRAAHADRPLIGREGFGQLAAEYGLRQYTAAHDWAVWAMTQLDDAQLDDAQLDDTAQLDDSTEGPRSGTRS